MTLTNIQIIAAVIFISSMAIGSIYEIIKSKRIRVGIIETGIIPITITVIILHLNLSFLFVDNIFLSIVGLLLLLIGLSLGFIASIHLGRNKDDFWVSKRKKKQRRLITSGPYAKMRHPIYTSMLLYYLGIILIFLHRSTIILYILLVLIISYTSHAEEKYLLQLFPEYKQYQQKTHKFFPKII